VRRVSEVIAETPADRQRQKLSAVEPEIAPAGLALRPVDDDRMAAGLAQSRLGSGHVAKLDDRRNHGKSSSADLMTLPI
jgi:hypothetical protein